MAKTKLLKRDIPKVKKFANAFPVVTEVRPIVVRMYKEGGKNMIERKYHSFEVNVFRRVKRLCQKLGLEKGIKEFYRRIQLDPKITIHVK